MTRRLPRLTTAHTFRCMIHSVSTSFDRTQRPTRPATLSPRGAGTTAGTTTATDEEESVRTCLPLRHVTPSQDETTPRGRGTPLESTTISFGRAFITTTVWYQYDTTTTTRLTREGERGIGLVPASRVDERGGVVA